MGALTSNRKRRDDYFSKSPAWNVPHFDHIAKKPKLSPSLNENTLNFDRPVSVNSIISRIFRYPDSGAGSRRVIHAPVRSLRFGSFVNSRKVKSGSSVGETSSDRREMGNIIASQWGSPVNSKKFEPTSTLGQNSTDSKEMLNKVTSKYENAREDAFNGLKFSKKAKQVIEVDEKEEGQNLFESSGRLKKEIDVVEIDSDGNEQEGVSDSGIEELGMVDNKWKESKGVVDNEGDGKGKIMDAGFRSLDSSVVSDVSNVNVKEDDTEKLKNLSLGDPEIYVPGVPLHKKLYASAEKRSTKISRLDFDIEMFEKIRRRYQLLRPSKKVEDIKKDEAEECFVPLTEEEEAEVDDALSNSTRRRVLVTHSNIDITGEILQCLQPRAWLNDEVINVYLELLKEREKREPQKFLKCHFFNTFFFKKLIAGKGGYNFQSVRRWTTQRKLGYSLFNCDKIFVPIHKEIHWCLAIINKKEEKIQYLDSLGGVDTGVMRVLARYFVDEVKDKTGRDIDISSWRQEAVENLPEQENGYDCGMFMIKYSDFFSRGIRLCFNQEHMPYFRRRTVKEILRLRAE